MSSNSCLFPINFVISCQGDFKKKDKPKFTTSLIKTLQWFPIVLRIYFVGKTGHYLFLALTLLESLTSELITIFNICCPHRTSGGNLVSCSLWALPQILAEWLTGYWYVKRETLKHPAGKTSSACHSMAPTGAGEPTLTKTLLQVQQLILYATHPKNSPVLEIWTGYLISLPASCQNFFTSEHTERGIFVCHTGCCCLKPEAKPAGALAAPRAEWINILTIAHLRHTGWDALL